METFRTVIIIAMAIIAGIITATGSWGKPEPKAGNPDDYGWKNGRYTTPRSHWSSDHKCNYAKKYMAEQDIIDYCY